MATTGTAVYPSTTTYPDTNVYPGQGTQPIVRCRLSFDDVSTSIPAWTEVATSKFRSFTVDRGRESELSEFDAGTASVVLDNRDRAYDPTLNSSVRPMNQVWLYEEFTGEVHDLFRGYVESWDQNWPSGGWSDAEAVVSAADEFKVLALDKLPVTSPPRSTYRDVVAFDAPHGYWSGEPNSGYEVQGNPGQPLTSTSTEGVVNAFFPAAIVGEPDDTAASFYILAGGVFRSQPLEATDPGDPGGLSSMTAEAWVRIEGGFPTGTDYLVLGPLTGSFRKFWLAGLSTGQFQFRARSSTPTDYTATGGTLSTTPGIWYHLVGVVDGSNTLLYVNGVQVASASWSGTFATGLDAGTIFSLGNAANVNTNWYVDEAAFYRHTLSADRIAAHYTAGANRGFARAQTSGPRIGAVLDSASSKAARRLGTGARPLQGEYMSGQPPLEVLQRARQGDAVDAALFTASDGTLVYLDSAHRSSSPYNTSQVTIGDAGGSEIPYADIDVDYSESFLANEWNVTRDGGTLQSTSDATSISRYFKRSQSLSSLPLTDDSDAAAVATAMLAKYKDPMLRVTSVSFSTADPTVAEAVLERELCDRITVRRTPPGGGARISQDLFIQKISVRGDNSGAPWNVTWVVSPL